MSFTKFFAQLFQRKYFYPVTSQNFKKPVLNILRNWTVNIFIKIPHWILMVRQMQKVKITTAV